MNKNITLILISLGVLFLLSVVLVIVNQNPSIKKNPGEQGAPSLEVCKTLAYGGEEAINIVFFSDEKTAERYKDFFLSAEPFTGNSDAFNFYYIDSFVPECELYEDVAIFCHSSELVKKAASCPNDFLVIIESREPNIRSSSYLNVMSLNEKTQLSVFLHEFGHAFASLAEEYAPASLSSSSKNCVKKCSDFNGLEEGCYQGCSKVDYYRSIEAGVMRTLNSERYGRFNEHLLLDNLEKKTLLPITGRNIDEQRDCSKETYYLLIGTYHEGIMDITNKSIETGCVGGNGDGGFRYSVKREDGSSVNDETFNPELIYTDSQKEEVDEITGEVYLSDRPFTLKISSLPESRFLEVFDYEEREVLNIAIYDIDARACRIS